MITSQDPLLVCKGIKGKVLGRRQNWLHVSYWPCVKCERKPRTDTMLQVKAWPCQQNISVGEKNGNSPGIYGKCLCKKVKRGFPWPQQCYWPVTRSVLSRTICVFVCELACDTASALNSLKMAAHSWSAVWVLSACPLWDVPQKTSQLHYELASTNSVFSSDWS